MWRYLAQDHSVSRYYLVPSGEHTRRLAERQASEDRTYNLVSMSVPVEGYGGPRIPMNTLWLIDDCLVVRQEPGTRSTGSWLVTRRPSEIARAQDMTRTLQSWARRHWEPTGPDLTASLLMSAEMLHHLAQMSCRENRLIDETGCAWYHGAWQYLRFFDMVSSPTWHTRFYMEHLREAIHRGGVRRILISGSADYTTLAFVLLATRCRPEDPPVEVDVHVLDMCRTPLLACQWFAERNGVKVSIHQADITRKDDSRAPEFRNPKPFDLIIADAFLTRFDPIGVKSVLSRWFDLLIDGGEVLTTVRLHPSNEYVDQDTIDLDNDDERQVTDPVDDFELRLRERATMWQDMLPIDLETLSRAGRQYAKRMMSHDLGDADSVRKAFEGHQFEIDKVATARVRGELMGTEYLRVVARRPDTHPAGATPD
jgi:hypothetical protein